LVKRSDCSTGGFYKSPTANQTVSTSHPVNVAWDNTCLQPAPKQVDIYLYAPGHNTSLIQAFNGADYAHGSMDMTLNPSWWGNNATISLQLSIVSHGSPSFMTSIPAGPIFVATYNSSDPHATPKSSSNKHPIIQDVKKIFHKSPGGSIAAGVIVPLLIIAIATFFYIRHQRMKRVEKTKRFSQVVDQRMSTISADWRSISGVGASAAIRASMVDSSAYGRPASFPSTTESGQAGVGARFNNMEISEQDVPRMSQLRNSRFSSGERSSRVISFATDPRQSAEGPHTPRTATGGHPIYTRSFHQAQTFYDDNDSDLQLSPRQSRGPLTLSNSEIEARTSTGGESLRREMLQMPAMTLMRTGKQQANGPNNDLILPAPILRDSSSLSSNHAYHHAPMVPLPTFQPTTSPIPPPTSPSRMGTMSPPMNPALSPDDLLRAYALGRAGSVLGNGAQTVAGGTANTGMRILYTSSPEGSTTASSPLPMVSSPASILSTPVVVDNNPFRGSMAARSVYTDSVYSRNVDADVGVDDEDRGSAAYVGYGTAK